MNIVERSPELLSVRALLRETYKRKLQWERKGRSEVLRW
jgi:hypothetical protein